MAGLAAARARGRKGGRKFALTEAQVRLAQAAMAKHDTSVTELCKELGIRPVTLYRYVNQQANCAGTANGCWRGEMRVDSFKVTQAIYVRASE